MVVGDNTNNGGGLTLTLSEWRGNIVVCEDTNHGGFCGGEWLLVTTPTTAFLVCIIWIIEL
jgi:hypothetical protein